MPRLTPAQRDAMKTAIHNGDRYRDIAARFGISESTVSNQAREWGYRRHGATATRTIPQIHPDRLTELLAATGPTGGDEWMEAGACRTLDVPDVMYPDAERDSAPAKKLCARCPVKQTCLEWALTTREQWGVWGGLTERDRLHLTKTTRPAQRAQEEAPAC